MANYVFIDRNICKGCGLCTVTCPKKILALDLQDLNEKGYNPACVLQIDDCIACGMCAIICPDSAITVKKEVSA